MAANIQVVLREDVSKLGKAGELVRVKPGYARNFLLPRGLAVVASAASVSRIEHEKKAAVARAAKMRTSLDAVAQTLSGVTVTIAKQTGEEGRLYGSVTTKEIADALKAKGFDVDKKKLVLGEHRQLGTFDVTAKLGGDVTATFKLEVVAKE